MRNDPVPEIAAAPFASLGSGGDTAGAFLSGLRADALSELAREPGVKVYAESFDPTAADFDGLVASAAVVRTADRLHVLVALSGGGAPSAEALDLPLADLARAPEAVARAVLDLALPERRRARRTPTPALSQSAYEALLLARHHARTFSPADSERATALYGSVLDAYPDHAPALSGLAATLFQRARYGSLGTGAYDDALAHAEHAVAADPADVEGHVVRALVALYRDRDTRAAAAAFHDALALDRDHVVVLREYVWLLYALGRTDEAVGAADRALEYDPLSVDLLCTKADALRRDPATALALFRRAHALDGRYARAVEGVAWCSAALGDRDEAYRALDLYRRHAPSRHWRHRVAGEVAARFGDGGLHRRSADALHAYARDHPEADLSADLASVYALTDPDRAMPYLARAFRNGVGLVSVLGYPTFDSLRGRDDYRALVADIETDLDLGDLAARRATTFVVRAGADVLSVSKPDFVGARADRNYVGVVRARGGRAVETFVRLPLGALAGQLGDADIVRVHRSALANLSVPGWRLDGGPRAATLRLDRLGVRLPVSRARYADVRRALDGAAG